MNLELNKIYLVYVYINVLTSVKIQTHKEYILILKKVLEQRFPRTINSYRHESGIKQDLSIMYEVHTISFQTFFRMGTFIDSTSMKH